jgi:DNA adenine methylase
MTGQIKSPVMRYHGAKFRLAEWVMSFFPAHECYVEPFGGAAGVLMQKQRSYAEVYNDLDKEVVNVFQVLRDPEMAKRLIEQCQLTPFSREEFIRAYEETDDPIEMARRMLFRSQAGFGTGAASGNTSGFRSDSKRSYSLSSHIWGRYPENIAAFCERLQGVIIENRPAIDLIAAHDSPETLFFVDPPYVLDTRKRSGQKTYRHEMTDDDHVQLLDMLNQVQGYVVLSGYPSELYSSRLTHWSLHQKTARASGFRGTVPRTECAWLNPKCAAAVQQPQLELEA